MTTAGGGGSAKRLVASLVGSNGLTDDDIAELREFLRNKLSKVGQYYLWLAVLLRLIVPLTPSFGLATKPLPGV